ncbi:unnamed protein product, partial [Rotaria sordida]
TKSNVWSYSILTWEIMTYGGTPYTSIAAENMFDYLRDGNRMSQPVNCPNEILENDDNTVGECIDAGIDYCKDKVDETSHAASKEINKQKATH